jgi:hypothetical protein
MTEALQKVIEKLVQLPPEEQDAMASLIHDTLDSDRRWDELFARPESEELLSRMADAALQQESMPLENFLEQWHREHPVPKRTQDPKSTSR